MYCSKTKKEIEVLAKDQEVLGLNIKMANPKTLDVIVQWAKKQENLAIQSENYELATKYRDILYYDLIFVRKTNSGFLIL
jgi:hypothetical protein